MCKAILFALWLLIFCNVANANDCIAALRPDQIAVSNDYAFEYALLQSINQSNYAEHQSSGNTGAQYLGIAGSASYADFNAKREQFLSRYDQNIRSRIKTDYVFNGLSEAGYRAYSDCIRAQGTLSAWVESYNNSTIVARVSSAVPGGVKTSLVVTGADPTTRPLPFNGAGEQVLAFHRPADDDFLAAFQLTNEAGFPIASSTIKLAKTLKLKMTRNSSVVHFPGKCGAGCHGEVKGCQNVTNVDARPADGFQFASDLNFKEDRETAPGTPRGVASWESANDIKPDRLTVKFSCVGDNKDGQHFIFLDVSITQFKETIEEDK